MNFDSGDFCALPVTSKGYHKNAIPLSGYIENGCLPKESWVRTDRVITLHQALVIRSFAMCSHFLLNKAIKQLCDYLQSHG